MKKVLSVGLLLGAAVLAAACIPLAKKEKAGIQVMTNDISSTVYLDGNYLEKTPLIKDKIGPGSYTLKIQPDDPGYVPYETTVQLHPGSLTVVTWNPSTRIEYSGGIIFEMEPIKSKDTAEVSVVTIPDGAIIKLGESDKEFAPFIFQDVSPGEHDLEIVLPSYISQNHTLDVPAGYRLLINVKLAKESSQAAASGSENAGSDLNHAAEATSSSSAAGDEDSGKNATTSATFNVPKPRVQIKATGFYNGGKEVLRVRDAAGLSGQELGFAPVGNWYAYLNETEAGWYKIDFEDQEGWISKDYAVLEE